MFKVYSKGKHAMNVNNTSIGFVLFDVDVNVGVDVVDRVVHERN